MEKYETPSMEIVELEGSIVMLVPGIDFGHGSNSSHSATCN